MTDFTEKELIEKEIFCQQELQDIRNIIRKNKNETNPDNYEYDKFENEWYSSEGLCFLVDVKVDGIERIFQLTEGNLLVDIGNIEEFMEEYVYCAISDNKNFYDTFTKSITQLEEVLNEFSEPDKYTIFNDLCFKMIHVNVITIMETYLSDAFINTVLADDSLIRKFVENTSESEIKDHKFPLQEIYKQLGSIKKVVKSCLLNITYHNLGTVRPMYEKTLGVKFIVKEFNYILNATQIRHDIVHRNGKKPEKEEWVNITYDNIKILISYVKRFINNINQQLDSIKEKKK